MLTLRWIATGPPDLTTGEGLALITEELAAPAPGEITIEVVSAGVNPADLKHARAATEFPHPLGYEVAGRVIAIGSDTTIASGPVAPGDDVLAFRVRGGYATALNVPAAAVFAKPPTLGFDAAAGLLLAATTAADMLRAAAAKQGELILVHGASGAVGSALLQLARSRGIRVIGTGAPKHLDRIADLAAVPVAYGPGLTERVREAAAMTPLAAVLDAAGTDEAINTSLQLATDISRIVTVAAPRHAAAHGFVALAGRQPRSAAYRDQVRAEVIGLAAAGELSSPPLHAYSLNQAPQALADVAGGHLGGKAILHPAPWPAN